MTDGSLAEVYRCSERVLSFDFDPQSVLLAVGTESQAVVYNAMSTVSVAELSELETDYAYKSDSPVDQVRLVRQADHVLKLILGKSCTVKYG